MDFKDYYKILGVSKSATDKEIKAAFRKAARKYHPDVNPGKREAEARFKEVNEANEVLSDPEKRRHYDEMGSNWSAYQGSGSGWPAGQRVRVETRGFGDQGEFAGFSDFFKTFFGGGGSVAGSPFGDLFEQAGAAPAPGADLEGEVELTLEEVLAGTTRTVATGGARGQRRVEVRVPPGVREGSRVRVAGEGAAGARGAHGDLYLRVRIRPHPQLERKGDDLHTTVQVPLTTAVLGGEASVPTLEGPRQIRIPAGTPVGRVFRLRGQGLPRRERGGGRGDLLASLGVALPETLTERERELFQELRRLGR